MDEELRTAGLGHPARGAGPDRTAEGSSTAAVEIFDHAFGALTPFRLEEAVRAELRAEAGTVLAAFAGAVDDVGVRESMALAGLLARRAAELGLSGVEMGAVIEAMLEAIEQCREPLPERHRGALRGVMIEGFGRALEERARERDLQSRIACTRPLVLARRCVGVVLQGSPAAEWIAAAVESLGPALLANDAAAVAVIARFDEEPSAAAIAELAAFVDVAGVVGARVFFSLPEEASRALRARVGERAVILGEDEAAVLERALATSKQSPVRARVAGLLRRLGV